MSDCNNLHKILGDSNFSDDIKTEDNIEELNTIERISLTTTDNGEIAFVTTGDLNLDFFGTVNRGISPENLLKKFKEAWNENQEHALKIVLNFRDIRNGKGEKLIGNLLMFFIKVLQPDIYSSIIERYIDMGSWKDILFLAEITFHYNDLTESNFTNDIEINLFKTQLNKDINSENPSLCAKWAPSEGCHYDKNAKIAHTIMEKMNLSPREYRKMLTELRKKISIVESMLSQNNLDLINFSTLPAKAHLFYKKAFSRDENAQNKSSVERRKLHLRYQKYTEDLKSKTNNVKANFKGIMPHEITRQIINSEHGTLLENQWESIRNNVKTSGIFDFCVSVVDVSGSMDTSTVPRPLDVAIALGILVSECAVGPFNNKVITFHEDPQVYNLAHYNSLEAKVKIIKNMPWGGNTDIEKVFDKIIEIGKNFNIPRDRMPKRLFIFTDMQFDKVSGNKIKTFDKIKEKFNKNNYTMPQIVCWNLSNVKSVIFTKNDENICMLSGYSSEILKSFLTTEKIDPCSILLGILSKYKLPENLQFSKINSKTFSVSSLEVAIDITKFYHRDSYKFR